MREGCPGNHKLHSCTDHRDWGDVARKEITSCTVAPIIEIGKKVCEGGQSWKSIVAQLHGSLRGE